MTPPYASPAATMSPTLAVTLLPPPPPPVCFTCDSTVCMEGMTPPCASPTATRAATMSPTREALPGVTRQAVDQARNETIRVARPPQRCAAQPPGICAGNVGGRGGVAASNQAGVCCTYCACWMTYMHQLRPQGAGFCTLPPQTDCWVYVLVFLRSTGSSCRHRQPNGPASVRLLTNVHCISADLHLLPYAHLWCLIDYSHDTIFQILATAAMLPACFNHNACTCSGGKTVDSPARPHSPSKRLTARCPSRVHPAVPVSTSP